ncbi:phosphoribosyltransferase [Devosia oryzisoli]|uniref:phosphoribosyltransferase n=1 Tax=Devosia oryzisoli TaxID=2774138 RepID=UPI0020C0DF32|nr:phosphoribosyltransferase family protein [Devosia oryzisoli]
MATHLTALGLDNPIVYALPRGGVPVASEIARALMAPLDLIMVRKIGAPGAPELALGAVVDGAAPQTVINEGVREATGAGQDYLERARAQEVIELERRRSVYLGDREPRDPAGHTAILVDDGLATGATMKAAILAMRQRNAKSICVAVPVAPRQTIVTMEGLADHVVCLHPTDRFAGVGAHYDDFHQLTDEETVGLLREIWSETTDVSAATSPVRRQVIIPPMGLIGDLCVPPNPRGLSCSPMAAAPAGSVRAT